jgi:hypothetical protein
MIEGYPVGVEAPSSGLRSGSKSKRGSSVDWDHLGASGESAILNFLVALGSGSVYWGASWVFSLCSRG